MDSCRKRVAVSIGRVCGLAFVVACGGEASDDGAASSPDEGASLSATADGSAVPTGDDVPPPGWVDGVWEEAAPHLGARPPVILIVIDTLRQDHLGCYGHAHATSPHLDAFASSAARFTRVTSQAPWTTPSMAALMTSRHPSVLGILDERSVLPDGETSLAEALRHEGYHTGAAVSHSFCSARWGFEQGFDWFDESLVEDHFTVSAPGITDLGIQFVDEHRDEPFFLWLHYFDPHFAYVLHEEFAYDLGDYEGPVDSGMRFGDLVKMRHQLAERDLDEVRRLYDSEITQTDHHLGRLFDHLRAQGVYDDALIIVAADHGEEFMEHRSLGHTKTVYEEVVSVPLLIKLPHARRRVVETPAMLVDVMPTVMDYLGLERSDRLFGRSLLRAPKQGADRPVFTETSRKNLLDAVLAGRFKLIHDRNTDSFRLFDLEADPGEQRDVWMRHPQEQRRLQQRLARWNERKTEQQVESQSTDLSDADRERLEALGYLRNGEQPPSDQTGGQPPEEGDDG